MIKPHARGDVRALVGAVVLGSGVALTIAGAFWAGAAARDQVVRPHLQRLAGAAVSGFSSEALASAAEADPGALAIARRHDPLAGARLGPRERRIAQLVDRLGAARVRPAAARSSRPESGASGALAHVADALRFGRNSAPPMVPVRFAAARLADPFSFRGLVEQSRDLDCLAQAVYYEARGETAAGQAAVAQVVLNRVRHPAFPKSVCAVVFQGARSSACQFAFVCNGATHRPTETLAWRRAEDIAARALKGAVMADIGEAVSFHTARSPTGWGPGMQKVAQIGAHVFYRFAENANAARLLRETAEAPEGMGTHPVYASLAPPLPSAREAGEALAAGAAAVERAATVVENAAKAAVSPQRPAEPAAAPASDGPVKSQAVPG